MIKGISTYIEKSRGAICRSLKDLVSVPTINPPGENYREIVNLLKERCQTLGMKTKIVKVPKNEAQAVVENADQYPRMNLITRWDVGAKKTVHFNAHYDVVPVSGKWRMDPFQPEVVGDWLYGRGATDMKDSITALLFAIKALKGNRIRPAFNIECSFTCDEEIGGVLGAGYLVRKGLVQADFVVNCEGGAGVKVGNGHNGVLWLEVTVQGKSAHASRPDKGVNAFEKTAELVTVLQKLKKRFEKPKRIFKMAGGVERRPTINIGGVFQGTSGDKANTIPGQVMFTIDRRIPPNERLRDAETELKTAIKEACKSVPGLKVKVTPTLRIEPCLVDVTHPFVQDFARVVRSVRRNPVQFVPTTGFTDLHYFVEEGKIPGVGYGVRGKGAHGADERVRISDLIKCTKTYAAFMVGARLEA